MSTTSILNNLFRLKSNINENFDMSKEEILKNELPSISFIERHANNSPIEAEQSKWQVFDYGDYTALNRTYRFNSKDHLKYFIIETLNESERLNHDIKMTIESMSINIITYTHDFNDVTDADLKLSKIIDEIYQDIFFIG